MYKKFWCFTILILLLLAGCNINSAEQPVSEPPAEEEIKEPQNLSPYTGLPVEELLPRPFAVIIENHNKARPQAGLQEASIVYEILAEGGISRFLALFTEPGSEKIGPVRSARPYFALLAIAYDAVLAHCGYSRHTPEIFNNYNVEYIDERPNEAYFWRSQDRQMPHNLYTNLEKLKEGAIAHNFWREAVNVPSFNFVEEEALPPGTPRVIKVNLPYSNYNNVFYEWDSVEKGYVRYNNGAPHIDVNTDKPITVKNIIIKYVTQEVISAEGHLKIDMVGEGKGLLIKNGKVEKISWKLEQPGKQTRFYVMGGGQIELVPGNTWIHYLPVEKQAEVITEEL